MKAAILENWFVIRSYEVIFFPVGFAKASFKYVIFNRVRGETLTKSFLKFIKENERWIFSLLLNVSEKFPDEAKDWEVLIDCGATAVVNQQNIENLMIKAVNVVFIERPCVAWINMKLEMESFLKNLKLEEIDAIYTLHNLTTNSALHY